MLCLWPCAEGKERAAKPSFSQTLHALLAASSLYLNNPVTEKILFKPVRVSLGCV